MTTFPSSDSREGDDVPRALQDVLLERLQRGLALLLDLDLDPVPVQKRLEIRQVVVGVPDDPRDRLGEVVDLSADRVGQQRSRPRRAPRGCRRTRARIASPRGNRRRSSIFTSGLRISATVLAAIRISTTGPAARASAHRPSNASGSSTSWTQRGTTTVGGGSETARWAFSSGSGGGLDGALRGIAPRRTPKYLEARDRIQLEVCAHRTREQIDHDPICR